MKKLVLGVLLVLNLVLEATPILSAPSLSFAPSLNSPSFELSGALSSFFIVPLLNLDFEPIENIFKLSE